MFVNYVYSNNILAPKNVPGYFSQGLTKGTVGVISDRVLHRQKLCSTECLQVSCIGSIWKSISHTVNLSTPDKSCISVFVSTSVCVCVCVKGHEQIFLLGLMSLTAL